MFPLLFLAYVVAVKVFKKTTPNGKRFAQFLMRKYKTMSLRWLFYYRIHHHHHHHRSYITDEKHTQER